jgi:AhpC/TSA family
MNSNNPSTPARDRLIMVLRDHYVANADLDLLIDEFPHGDTPLEAEGLLRKIAAESPHDYVRATALFELAEVLVAQAFLYEAYKDISHDKNLDAMIAMQTSERTKDWLRRGGENVKRIRNAYRERGTKAMTTEAERLYEQVATQFADVRRPERRWEGPEDVRLVDDYRESVFRNWSLAERADTKRFQMTNLRLDQPAPILEGTDYFHKRIRLSDFAGKVVVLTVTMGTVGEKEMYARCSKLLEGIKDQPVVCLSVVPTDGDGGYSVRDIVRETGITWPIIRDTRGDRLAHRWCQQTFPEAYVIDAKGVIRFHEAGRDSVSGTLVNKVKELLKLPEHP